jgi:hypothetical protein
MLAKGRWDLTRRLEGQRNLNFHDIFSRNPQISNFMEIRPMGAELFHADGRTDWHAWRRRVIILVFRLSPYCWCRVLSTGYIPGVWIKWVDVSEPGISSIFLDEKRRSECTVCWVIRLYIGTGANWPENEPIGKQGQGGCQSGDRNSASQ